MDIRRRGSSKVPTKRVQCIADTFTQVIPKFRREFGVCSTEGESDKPAPRIARPVAMLFGNGRSAVRYGLVRQRFASLSPLIGVGGCRVSLALECCKKHPNSFPAIRCRPCPFKPISKPPHFVAQFRDCHVFTYVCRAEEKYEVELGAWKHKTKGQVVSDPPVEPEHPKEERLVVADITMEKLVGLLVDNPMGLLVERDELAG